MNERLARLAPAWRESVAAAVDHLEAAGFGGGGIHGRRSLEGTFLGACIFTARQAARAIAQEDR